MLGVWALIPLKAAPSEHVHYPLDGAWHLARLEEKLVMMIAYLVGVFDPEKELPMVDPREEVVVEGSPKASNVKVTGRGGGIPDSDFSRRMFMRG